MAAFNLDGNIFVPVPLLDMKKSLKKKHSRWTETAEDLYNQYILKSGNDYEKMADLIFSKIKISKNIYDFTPKDSRGLQESINEMDDRFREISEFISTLKISEIKTVMVACYDRTVKTLWINRSNVLRDMLEKDTWNEADALFYSYFNMFINVMSRMVIEISHETAERSRNLISMTGLVSVVYGGIILAYTEGVLEYDDILERMSDLSTFSGTFNIGSSRRIRKALEATKSVTIFSDQE
jgi:gas vesicle protein